MPKRSHERPARGVPARDSASRDSLLLGALHGAGGDKDSNDPAPREHSAVRIGNVSVVVVDAENPSAREGDVVASNIMGGGKKRRNRGGGRPPTQHKQYKLSHKNNGDESLPFQELVQFLEFSGWICTRSFVTSERYLLEVMKPDRDRRNMLRLVPRLSMDSQYDAARELTSLVKHELFPGCSSVPALYLTQPNGTCGYQILEATCAMEKLLHSEPPLFVSGSAGIYGLRAMLNSVDLLDKQTAFEDCLKKLAAEQRESVLDGIVDVTRETSSRQRGPTRTRRRR